MTANDGWQIKKQNDGWVALYTPDVSDLDKTLAPKHTYGTAQKATAYAEGNHTANGVVRWETS